MLCSLNSRLKLRRDTELNWSTNNPILLDGELIVVDTNDGKTRFKIGDGINNYSSLTFIDDNLIDMIVAINECPVSTTDDDGKILSVVNGVPTWVSINDIITIQAYYTGSDEPDDSLGTDGDLYLQTT